MFQNPMDNHPSAPEFFQPEQNPQEAQFDFYQNLADSPEQLYNDELQFRLKTQVEEEFQARTGWYDKLIDGLEAQGLTTPKESYNDTNDLPIVNPTFLHTILSLTAEFSDDLFKPNNVVEGEVKNKTALNENPESAKQSEIFERIADMAKEDLNHKIMFEWDDLKQQVQRGMRSSFLTGSAFFKVYFDEFFRRPVVRFIPPENILIPPDSPSLSTAERITHVFELSKAQVVAYQRAGYFKEFNIESSDSEITYSEGIRSIKDEIIGVKSDNFNESRDNKKYLFTESEVFLSQDDINDPFIENNPNYSNEIKNGYFPYKITAHYETGEFLNITRNWDPEINYKIIKIMNLFQLLYMPGESIQGEGLTTIAMNMHINATTIMRELTSSIRLANTSTGIMSSNINVKSDMQSIEAGRINFLPTSDGTLDGFQNLPFNQPNPLFFEYLQFLEGKISSIAGISTIKGENIPSNMQASALFALMEKESKPMSGVMQRFIEGLNHMFSMIQRIMAEDLGHEPFGDPSLGLTNKDIYGAPITLLSSCDPTLSNSSLRILQMQTLFEFATQHPELHNMLEVYQRLYQVLKINDIHQMLITEEQYQEMQKQQQEQQQQQIQQQQQQAQAMQQQAQQQNALLQQELQAKQQADAVKAQLQEQKLKNDMEIDQAKMQVELMKEQGENVKQRNIEEAQMYKSQNDFLIEQYKLELEKTKIELERLRLEVETGLEIYLKTLPPTPKEAQKPSLDG